ncbi:MAG: class I tRNA ligase family protein, partial [bacterium]|nr:class I tRNA ligase family protein [bacterium]
MFTLPEKDHNFIEMEKKWLDTWYTKGLVQKYLNKNDSAKDTFSFLDGPITANNPMGVHHAWGRTYKDLWQKFHNLLGHKQRFQNGFDCQGLWVEVEVEKDLKLRSKKDIENLIPGKKKESIAKFVDLCKQRVFKYSAIQTEQSKRLGYLMDWDHSYFTMSDENNYMIWLFLKTCFDNGWIYKGHDSVPWCPRCETAISQHEMLTEDYKEVVHESIYFELPIKGRKNEYLLVWTTTPWTLPANIAVTVDPDLEYSLVEGETGDTFWIAKNLVEKVFKKNYKSIVKTVKGSELVGLKYTGPFDNLPAVARVAKENPTNFHTVIPTDKNILPISIEEGTGLVHTAVSAGTEDFKLGKKLGLPMIPVIADEASYIKGLGQFTGKNAKKNPRLILDYLIEKDKAGENWVFEIHNYKHRYPACWRCKTELVWKVADEWYIAMDKPVSSKLKVKSEKLKINKTLRERMVETAKKIQWMPEFGLDRELDWLKNMHDWLISKKNRFWGLALPIYECTKCGHYEVIGSKEELEKRAVKGWKEFEGHSPHKPYIDEVIIKCAKCGEDVRRIDDVGNPWLDAGIVPFSTIAENNQGEPLYTKNRKEWEKWFPVDFITESFPGQFKNWFYALIAMSTVLEDTNPFKTVLGFGTLVGEDGKPMHKSWGNSVEFNEGADKIGVDVMRWMYSRQNPADNLPFGYKKADEIRRQFYLILWNTYKYFIEYANQDKFKVQSSKLKIENKSLLDK